MTKPKLRDIDRARIMAAFESVPVEVTDLGCHVWLGSMYGNGYGSVSIGGRNYRAHRVAFFLANGDAPDELFVCHKCDFRLCVNPDHLFAGTGTDNMQDCLRKGRNKPGTVRGGQHGMVKLTEANVREIFFAEEAKRSIARRFNITPTAVRRIKGGLNWKHLGLSLTSTEKEPGK